MSKDISIHPPPVMWKHIKDYNLTKLREEFEVPIFQRKKSVPHIRKMIHSILNNTFYDNVIKYYVDKKGKYQLLDGQQRIEALTICHEKHGLERYNILFGVYEEGFARIAFRRLNMGKPLQTRDHSKALDDGKVPFFGELQPWLGHERTVSKSTYVEMLHALNYARGRNQTVQTHELDSVVASITIKELELMKDFCEALRIVSPIVMKSIAYRVIYYRNIFRIGYDNHFTKEQFKDLFRLAMKNKMLEEITKSRNHNDIIIAYKLICEELLPKVIK